MVEHKNYLNNFLLLIILLQLSYNYIVFPFKSTNPELNIIDDSSSDFVIKFMEEMDKNKLYTVIPIGDPRKEVVMYLSMLDNYFGIMKDYCTKEVISTYNPYDSNSFMIDKESSISTSDLYYAKKSNDTLSFYIDKQLKEKMHITFEFLTTNKTSKNIDDYIPDAFCGKIGFLKKYNYPYSKSFLNFIDYSKQNKIISSYQWGIFFFDKEQSYNIDKEIQNKYDGLLFVGLLESDYPNIFSAKDITNAYQLMVKTKNIGGKFTKIYFNYLNERISCQNELNFEMDIDHNYILCTKDYYDNIKQYYFRQYINNKICEEKTSYSYGEKFSMIICNLTIKNNLENFPTLYFFYLELNFTFSFNYKDLFMELDDKIYFLAIYHQPSSDSNTIWNLGKLITKKYSFMFNEDRKTLYFIHLKKYDDQSIDPDKDDKYDNNTTDNPDNSDKTDINTKPGENDDKSFWSENKEYILLGLLLIVLIFGLIFGYAFGRKVWEKHRKTRANELDDNYEYTKENDDDKLIN